MKMGQDQSKLYTLADLAEFYAVVQRGDILEFPRRTYSHFGVYIGGYKGVSHLVVHLSIARDDESEILGWLRKKLYSSQAFDIESTLENANLLYQKATGKEIGNLSLDMVETIMGPGGLVRIRSDYDETYPVNEQDNIFDQALQRYHKRQLEDKPVNYSLFCSNCQHFANHTH